MLICPRHNREHQPREKAVMCTVCQKPTFQAAGKHRDCQTTNTACLSTLRDGRSMYSVRGVDG